MLQRRQEKDVCFFRSEKTHVFLFLAIEGHRMHVQCLSFLRDRRAQDACTLQFCTTHNLHHRSIFRQDLGEFPRNASSTKQGLEHTRSLLATTMRNQRKQANTCEVLLSNLPAPARARPRSPACAHARTRPSAPACACARGSPGSLAKGQGLGLG